MGGSVSLIPDSVDPDLPRFGCKELAVDEFNVALERLASFPGVANRDRKVNEHFPRGEN
jgi:hypothetical protein